MSPRDRERGVVLLIVLFFALLLVSSVATFTHRATIDAMISRNRESAARAEALARGGVRIAKALLREDALRDAENGEALDSAGDDWFRIREVAIETDFGGTLRLQIDDAGAKLNLNALFATDDGGVLDERTDFLLEELLEKVIDEMPVAPGEKLYDTGQLADSLIDWVDHDSDRQRGGPEDEYYQRQDPPYTASNQPLMSVDELRLIEGFDAKLVDAMRDYVTVYPYAGGGGINLNTAPPHVLALLYYDDGEDLVLAGRKTVRRILEARKDGGLICPEEQSVEGCTPIREIVTNAIYPPPTFRSQVFSVRAEARVGDVRRVVVAVIDRSEVESPQVLSWVVR